MRRLAFLAGAAGVLLTACNSDGTVTPQGGGAFEAPFTSVTALRSPTIVAKAFGRTVNNAAVVDSIVGEVALMKQLDGLVASGNTVVVVQHDMGMVAGSDWIIDMGPGAEDEGWQGGGFRSTRTEGRRASEQDRHLSSTGIVIE